jgi:transposase-like protein
VDKARYLVEAHVLEGRSVSELAAAHGVHRSWIYKLLARYREGEFEALRPRSSRPRSCRHQTSAQTVKAVVALRTELQAQGHDAGDRLPPCSKARRPSLGLDDLAHSQT